MRFLRSFLARFVITIGLLALSVWLSARFVVNTVNDGTIVSNIASTVLRQPALQSLIVERAQESIDQTLADQGVDPVAAGIEDELNDSIVATVESDDFIDAVIESIREVESSVIAQLTDDSLPLAPLSVPVDVSEPLYAALDAVPELARFIPVEDLEAIVIDPFAPPELEEDPAQDPEAEEPENFWDEDTVQAFRDGYDWVERANTWGIWIALTLLTLGFLLIRKKRWILPKFFLGLGVFTLALWWVAKWLSTDRIIGWMGDDPDPDAVDAIRDILPQASIDRWESSFFKWGIAFLVISAALYILVIWYFRRKKRSEEPEEEFEPEAVPKPGVTLDPEGAPEVAAAEASPPASGESAAGVASAEVPTAGVSPAKTDTPPPIPEMPEPTPSDAPEDASSPASTPEKPDTPPKDPKPPLDPAK